MRRLRGFTLVELLVVIVVIGILTSVTIIGYTRYQAGSRDTQRQAKAAVIAEALEKYYDANGEYPSCSALTSATVTQTGGALQGVDAAALVTPTATNGTANSIACNYLTSASSGSPASCANMSSIGFADNFAYVGDCSSTCLSGNSCLGFKLEYIDETTGNVDTITSRHTTNFNTSGTISTLTATPDGTNGFSVVNLAWTAIPNITSYTVEYSTNGFSTYGTLSPSPTTNSAIISSLSQGTTYQFRVEPIANDGSTTGWSNAPFATTWTLSTPTLTAGTIGPNSLQFSWGSVNHATSYTYQMATDSGFTNLVGGTPLTTMGTSATVSGLTTGKTYYIEVDATANGGAVDSGPSTPPLVMTTTVPVPTGLTATTNSSSQITASWGSVGVATSYTLNYSSNSSFPDGSTTVLTGLTSTSSVISGLTQGLTYYFQVFALVGTTSSAASSPANATTTVDTPGAPGIAAYRPGAVRSSGAGYWITSPGSGNYYYAYANLGGSCPAGTYSVFYVDARYNSPTTTYYAGPSTYTQWFMTQPTSGNYVKFGAEQYCQGASTNSGWSGWNYSCAGDPATGPVGCPF